MNSKYLVFNKEREPIAKKIPLNLREDFISALNDRMWCKRNGIYYPSPDVKKAKIKFYESLTDYL